MWYSSVRVCAVSYSFISFDAIRCLLIWNHLWRQNTHKHTHTHAGTYVKREEKRMLFMSTFYTPVKRSMLGDPIYMCAWYSDTYVYVDEYVHIQCQRSLLFRLFGSIIHFSIQTKAMAIEDEISIKKQKRL